MTTRAPNAPLSKTELVVLALIADGLTNREAAKALNRSVKTVEGHLTRIYQRLGVRNHAEATRMAVAMGVVPVAFGGVGPPQANGALK